MHVLHSISEFREPIENEWIDFARVDICVAGGITETKKIAAMAEPHFHRPGGSFTNY